MSSGRWGAPTGRFETSRIAGRGDVSTSHRRFKKPKLKQLKRMAIDEISIRKGPVSMTFVLNLDGGAVVFVRDGKEADALNPFWKRPKASHTRVEAVAMDLSAACRLAVTTHLAEAAIVYDWFHIVKLLNDKLTALRRDLYRNATDKEQRRVAGNPLADYQAVGEPGR